MILAAFLIGLWAWLVIASFIGLWAWHTGRISITEPSERSDIAQSPQEAK